MCQTAIACLERKTSEDWYIKWRFLQSRQRKLKFCLILREKGKIIANDERLLVERIALSLFKRYTSRKALLNISYLLFENPIITQQIAYIC